MKGIILAGGSGTRLYPLTRLHQNNWCRFMINQWFTTHCQRLMLTGIKETLIISTSTGPSTVWRAPRWRFRVWYFTIIRVQPSPDGLAQAFIIGEDFIGDDSVALVLGDNIFHGNGLSAMLQRAEAKEKVQQSLVTKLGTQNVLVWWSLMMIWTLFPSKKSQSIQNQTCCNWSLFLWQWCRGHC